ncbi:SDR family oxidoreductase [Anaerovorax odorimutans]|uniref:SDR family oxidoreductase n=2 Tax=Anaerovorax odorimutans TaxID=109327 RepID=A0ABT1RP57_9FIRM|nr:SDR family oxidoreductase [Anaerovorax odorimutans]MCQ4636965.1 SDR family oxidoreductase [Anaerovorax odorimutans]
MLKNKTILVTGGSSGIGRATVRMLAQKGYRVYFTYRNDKSAEQTSTLVMKDGVVSFPVKCDIADIDASTKMIDKIFRETGEIYGLVNCAGISNTKAIEEIDEKEWNEMLDTNLKGTFFLMQAAYGYMKRQNNGRIVTLTSIAGQRGGFFSGAHYCASKAGLEAIMKCFALCGAQYGVHSNAVSPGVVDTPMTRKEGVTTEGIPLKRAAVPEEVASVITFLLSADAEYINGTTIDVNGGQLMR